MGLTPEYLIKEMHTHLVKARTLFNAADRTGRDLTGPEQATVQGHLDAARSLKARAEGAGKSARTMAAIKRIGENQPGGRGVNTKLGALGGSDWGSAMLAGAGGGYGFKALTPSGQVNVTVPLNTEPVRIGEPVLAVRQLIPTETDTTGRFAYMRQTARTSNAAMVAPGALKPTSIYTLTRVDDRTRTLAHLSEPIPRQDLADAAMLAHFVDSEMRLGLETALEAQIIAGNGSGENFTGLANVSGIQTQAALGSDPVATTRAAVTKLEVISLAPGGWVMHPLDWEHLEMVMNNEGNYYLGNQLPVDRAARRLWGVPVALSTAATAGTAYLADFAGSTLLYVREEATLDWTEAMYDADALGAGVGASDWARNLIRYRCEGRFGFAVTRPPGIVKITLP